MNLKERTLQGITWTLVTRIATQVIQNGVSIVLARVLFPGDFGLFGMVSVFAGFAAIFIDFGVGSAIVQRQELEERQLRAAFTMSVVVGAATTLLVVAGAPLIAEFYDRPELVSLTRVNAVGFLLLSIGVVPRAMLQREMQIRRLMLFDLAVLVVSSTCSVVLAFLGAGVWSVIAAALVTVAGQALLPLFFGPWKVGFAVGFKHIRPLMSVSLNLFGVYVISYWSRNLDNLLIGRMLGETSLGLYTRAYTLMLLPMTQFVGVLGFSMLPMLSRVSQDQQRSKSLFLRATGILSLIGFPMMLGMASVASPFIRVVYGPRWVELIPLVRILSIVGALQMVAHPGTWIYVAHGRTDVWLRWSLWSCSATIVAIVVGAYAGSTTSIAIAYLLVNVLLTAPAMSLAGGLVGANLREVLRVVVKPALYGVLMSGLVLAFDWVLPAGTPMWLRLVADVALGATFYGAIAYLTKLESLTEVMRHWRARRDRSESAAAEPEQMGSA